MDYHHHQPPSPFGTRLPASILAQIYHLAILSQTPIPLDTTRPIQPPLLQTSSEIRSRFLPLFFETNTFTLRRASLCSRPEANNLQNRPSRPQLPPAHHRAYIRHLHLSTYNGARECLNLALGNPHRNNNNGASARLRALRQGKWQRRQESCPFCNPSTFPPLLALFPRLISVTIDVATNRDSGLSWRAFCRSVVQGREPVWVAWVGVGEVELRSEKPGLGLKVKIVDGKLQRIWERIRKLEPGEVREAVLGRNQSPKVKQVLQISERVAKKLLRLFEVYDRENQSTVGSGEDGWNIVTRAGARSGIAVPSDLRWDVCYWGKEFTTAWNWALREWLVRGSGGRKDQGFLRAMEGGGVRDVIAAGRLEAALLEEFEGMLER